MQTSPTKRSDESAKRNTPFIQSTIATSPRVPRVARVLQVVLEQLAADGHLELVERVLHHEVRVQVVYRVQEVVQAWRKRKGHVGKRKGHVSRERE
jgi:hypothetical protein